MRKVLHLHFRLYTNDVKFIDTKQFQFELCTNRSCTKLICKFHVVNNGSSTQEIPFGFHVFGEMFGLMHFCQKYIKFASIHYQIFSMAQTKNGLIFFPWKRDDKENFHTHRLINSSLMYVAILAYCFFVSISSLYIINESVVRFLGLARWFVSSYKKTYISGKLLHSILKANHKRNLVKHTLKESSEVMIEDNNMLYTVTFMHNLRDIHQNICSFCNDK